jgi:hypothetical protein
MLQLEIPTEKFNDFHKRMNRAGVNYRLSEATDETMKIVMLDSKKELRKAKEILETL